MLRWLSANHPGRDNAKRLGAAGSIGEFRIRHLIGNAVSWSRSGPFGSRLLGSADQTNAVLRARLQVLATVAILTANLVGAGVVTVLSGWVLPSPVALSHSMIVANAIAIPLYVTAAVVMGVIWGTRIAFGRLDWVLERRDPEAGEQRAALRTSLALVGVQATMWAIAVVLFTGLTQLVQPTLVLNVAVTVALGGLVTCMAAYLLTEFILRPMVARALTFEPAADLVVPGMMARGLLAWGLGSGIPVIGLILVAGLSLIRGNVSSTQLSVTMLALGATTIIVGLLMTWLSERAAVDPITALRLAVRRVESGDFDTEVVVYDASEIGLLQAGFNRMLAGLRERERIRDLFGRHVGHEVARDALTRDVRLGGDIHDVAVLFVDIIGSTELAATRPPDEVVNLLNRFFAVVVHVISDHGGTVNKFQGDGALAVFGAPQPLENHVDAALQAARTLQKRLAEIVPECTAGIGVAAGTVVAGNVGEEHRFEYTVIGDAVNEASRLCDQAKMTTGRVLTSMCTLGLAGKEEQAHWRSDGEVRLRGRSDTTQMATPAGIDF